MQFKPCQQVYTWGEFFDRLTIVIRKAEFSDKYKAKMFDMLVKIEGVKIDGQLLMLICTLKTANVDIWNLESEIRGGQEGKLGFEEVGRRSIKIREYNTKRISLINAISSIMGNDFEETKFEHISQGKNG